MPRVDRKNPKRAKSSASRYSLMEFTREFPDDDACLEWLWRERYSEDGKHADCPKCGREHVEFKQYATKQRRQTWTCTQCGHHVQPTAGTIFEGSSTALQLWFYAIHLMTSTKCGLAAKHLEREIGVTYKTAWRMLNLIRSELMAQDDSKPLTGEVEADETAYGGRPKASMTRGMTMPQAQTFAKRRKVGVVGMVERGGKVRAYVQPREGALDAVSRHVSPDATVYTDEWAGYRNLHSTHPAHLTIRHADRVYARGDVHTQTIEGFFGNVKNGIAGNYHGVSAKWLQGYLNEYVWRYNHRHDREADFRLLLLRAASGA